MSHSTKSPIVVLALAVGCGGSGASFQPNHVEDPQPQAGGGLGAGAILGELNVFVVDGDTDEPIEAARVQIGGADALEPLIGETDAQGRVVFRVGASEEEAGVVAAPDGSLEGPQVVTATADDYAATTWFGVNGAVVTLPMEPAEPPDDDYDTATVTGTITGWASLPSPPTGRLLVAYINYTARGDLDAPENTIPQAVHTDPLLSQLGVPQNTCVRGDLPPPVPPIDSCDWTLTTRTGEQVLYAGVLSIDPTATDRDPQFITYAIASGLDLAADETVADVPLQILGASDLAALTVTLEDPPSGLSEVRASAVLDLGDPGQMAVPLPTDGPMTVPKPTGDLDGEYAIYAQAVSDPQEQYPSSFLVERDVDVDGEVEMPSWLEPPDDIEEDLEAAPNEYRFDRVEGAVHSVSFDDTDGTRAWNVLFLEPPATGEGVPDAGVEPSPILSFVLPVVEPDPLPLGNVDLTANAFDIPGFDPLDFHLESIEDTIGRFAADQDTFRRE